MRPDISVVIPTYNRTASLRRTLQSISQQTYLPKEVLIVDASTEPEDANALKNLFPNLTILYYTSKPSVCIQRNFGIQMAKFSYILLCDDDIEAPNDYLFKMVNYLSENPETGIATGCVLQKNELGKWVYQYPTTSFFVYLWNFIFQLSVWGDFSEVKTNIFTKPIFVLIKQFYDKRRNSYTLAGWPLITSFTKPVTRTSIYGLGASVIKREWLISSPFDEQLVPSGIGDNYGITIKLRYNKPIHILTEAYVYHHYAQENRLKAALSYQYRVFALHHFIKKSSKFNYINILFLYWSIVGHTIYQISKLNGKMVKVSLKTLVTLVIGMNPYK